MKIYDLAAYINAARYAAMNAASFISKATRFSDVRTASPRTMLGKNLPAWRTIDNEPF